MIKNGIKIETIEYKDFLDDFEKKNNKFFCSKNEKNSKIKNYFENNKKFSQNLKTILKTTDFSNKFFDAEGKNNSAYFFPEGKLFLIGKIEKEKIDEFLQARKFVRDWIKSKQFLQKLFWILMDDECTLENGIFIQEKFLSFFDEACGYLLQDRTKNILNFLLDEKIISQNEYEDLIECQGLQNEKNIFIDGFSLADIDMITIHEFGHIVDSILNDKDLFLKYENSKLLDFDNYQTIISKIFSKNFDTKNILKKIRSSFPKIKIDLEYHLQYEEIYAGVFELRKIFNLVPGEKITMDHISQLIESKNPNSNKNSLKNILENKDNEEFFHSLQIMENLSGTNLSFVKYLNPFELEKFLDYINLLP